MKERKTKQDIPAQKYMLTYQEGQKEQFQRERE